MDDLQRAFFEKYGVGAKGGSAIGVARGTSPGAVDPMLAGKSNEELAELDRLQFSRQVTGQNPLAGMVGGGGLAILDALKATGIQSKMAPLISALGGSDAAAKEWGPPTANTSAPSAGQAFANLRGVGLGLQDIYQALMGQ